MFKQRVCAMLQSFFAMITLHYPINQLGPAANDRHHSKLGRWQLFWHLVDNYKFTGLYMNLVVQPQKLL